MNPYLVLVRDHIRNGKQLCTVDMEYLLSIGICALGPRKMIQQAIELLLYFCYEAPTENLQTLAMKVRIACNNVITQFGLSMKLKEKVGFYPNFPSQTDQIQAVRRADIISILNIITCAVSQLSEDVKRFIFWLDRSPFDEQDKYMEIRKTTTELIWTIVRTTNSIPRELFESGPDIIKAWPNLASK